MPVEAPAPPVATPAAVATSATPAVVPAPVSSASRGVEPIPAPSDPPKPGSARERMREGTKDKWGEPASDIAPATPTKPEPKKPEDKPAEKPADNKPVHTPDDSDSDLTPEQKKENPWKLRRIEKKRADTLQKQLDEIKSKGVPDAERDQLREQNEKLSEKLKGYEDEMRFRAYEKSDEFKTKYEEPYERAWQKHMKDLRGVNVNGEDGVTRPMTANDILDLVNLELPDARKLAGEKFGDFAQDAMLARKEIRDLFEAKNEALEQAKKNGAEREKQFQENTAKWRAKVQKHISETWKAENERAFSNTVNGEFFKPPETDTELFEKSKKGYEQVDRAFSKNPWDSKLTDAEREKAVRDHAVIRNRSAAFGVLKVINQRLKTENAAFKKELDEMKASSPPAGGGSAATANSTPNGKARDRMHAAGDRWAK